MNRLQKVLDNGDEIVAELDTELSWQVTINGQQTVYSDLIATFLDDRTLCELEKLVVVEDVVQGIVDDIGFTQVTMAAV